MAWNALVKQSTPQMTTTMYLVLFFKHSKIMPIVPLSDSTLLSMRRTKTQRQKAVQLVSSQNQRDID